MEFLTQKGHRAETQEAADIHGVSGKFVLHVTSEDICEKSEGIRNSKANAADDETQLPETKGRGSLSDLSIEELAALCVGYGPGTPFAAVGDRSDPSTIFDADGNPLTINSHPTGYPGDVSPAIEKKRHRISILQRRSGRNRRHCVANKCSLPAPSNGKCGECLAMPQERSARNSR